VVVPVLAVLLFTTSYNPVSLVVLFPLVLIGGMLLAASSSVARKPPIVLFVTDRRAIVENPTAEGSSATIGLENLGNVEINQSSRAARYAGVAWVYLLPTGATKALVGSGRGRRAAPGVIWIPAVPSAEAGRLQSLLVSSARELQARLGYPTTIPDATG